MHIFKKGVLHNIWSEAMKPVYVVWWPYLRSLFSHRIVQYFCSVHMELTKQPESFNHAFAQQKFRRLWCPHRDGQILPYKNLNGYGVQIAPFKLLAVLAKTLTSVLVFKLLADSVNRSPKRTNIQPVENLSSICLVRCARSLNLNLVRRNFLLQRFTVLSIFRQNAVRSLIAVKHAILSESDDVKTGSAAWRNNTGKKNQQYHFNERYFICRKTGPDYCRCILDYLLVERNWARTVLCLPKMLLNFISSKRALNHRGASSGNTFIHLPIWRSRELIDLIHDAYHLCTHFRNDGIKANIKWYFRGQTNVKIAIARNRGPLCLFSQNRTTIQSRKMYGLSFGKISVIIACYDDIFGRYSIKKK